VIALLLLRAALAQDVSVPAMDGDLYRLPIDAQQTMWTDDAGRAPSGYVTARLAADYLHGPLALRIRDGQGTTTTQLVGDAFGLVLAGGATAGPVRFGLALPTWLLTTSDVAGAGGAGLGDLYADVKGTVLDPTRAPIGLAIAAGATLPTGTVDVPLSDPGFRWNVRLISDKRVGPLLIAANLGHVDQPLVEVGSTKVTDAFTFRFGGGYALGYRGGVSLDLAGQFTYGQKLFTGQGTPLEVMLGGWGRVSRQLVVRGGVGTGLTGAPGSPVVRTVLMLSWEPPRSFPDRDQDGIADRDDVCPDQPEDYDGDMDTDGCPDPMPDQEVTQPQTAPEPESPRPHVQITRERIEIEGKVFFDTNRATIRPESLPLLDEVAQTLKEHPELLEVRIDGHTDDRGTASFNQHLSGRRAAAVRDYLVGKGIDPDRLTSRGFGESKPLVQGEDEAAWAKNRRVEFSIVRRSDDAPAPTAPAPEAPADAPAPPADPGTGG